MTDVTILDQNDNGFDVSFNILTFPNNSRIALLADVSISGITGNFWLNIGRSGSNYTITLHNATEAEESFVYTPVSFTTFRLLLHGQFVTVYANDVWVHTFYPSRIDYPEIPTVQIFGYAGDGGAIPTVGHIVRRELSDWREAIYIDLESSAQNAITSIIQQRPIDIYGHHDGSISFVYEPETREEFTLLFVNNHNKDESENQGLCSDAIVYFTNVVVLSDTITAKDTGFITKMYRLPDLDAGAIRAARMMQKIARQNLIHHSITSRISLSLEIGDLARAQYVISGTNRSYNEEIIIEQIAFNISDGFQSMKIEGRDNA